MVDEKAPVKSGETNVKQPETKVKAESKPEPSAKLAEKMPRKAPTIAEMLSAQRKINERNR